MSDATIYFGRQQAIALAVNSRWCCVLLCVAFAGCSLGFPAQSPIGLAEASRIESKPIDETFFSAESSPQANDENGLATYDPSPQRSNTLGDSLANNPPPIVKQSSGSLNEAAIKNSNPFVPLLVYPTDGPKTTVITPIFESERISESFVENDVQEALQILAAQAKVQIIVDDMVTGVTNAVIESESFESALDKVLLPLGYVYRKVGDQYMVGIPDPASNLFSLLAERYDYHTNHLAPSELLELLPEHYKRFVRASEKRNLIIVEAPPKIAKLVVTDLERSDQPVDQVVLEVMICVYSPENSFQLGVDLSHRNSAFNLALAGLNLAATNTVNIGLQDFTHSSAVVNALASKGHVSIRATPRVMAKDGEMAKISIAKETFFSVQPGSDGAFFRQEIEKIEAGISLNITPVIRGDHVTLQIDRAEVSEGIDNIRSVESKANGAFPTINRRLVSTTVSVLDQETITIGGLVQRQTVQQLHKVPVLGSIPIVGKLFQRIDQREEETELIIFITPRIVREEAR